MAITVSNSWKRIQHRHMNNKSMVRQWSNDNAQNAELHVNWFDKVNCTVCFQQAFLFLIYASRAWELLMYCGPATSAPRTKTFVTISPHPVTDSWTLFRTEAGWPKWVSWNSYWKIWDRQMLHLQQKIQVRKETAGAQRLQKTETVDEKWPKWSRASSMPKKVHREPHCSQC